jgi:flagellar hook-associated protein 3 FlgL
MSRITPNTLSTSALRGLQTTMDRYSKQQDALSSGKVINKPSDDPTGTAAALSYRRALALNSQYDANGADGLAWLGATDSALQSASDSLTTVRDLAVQGQSTGNMDASARGALASQVDQLREQLLTTANTTYLGRPVFGGTTPGKLAYDTAGTFVGNSNPVNRTVGAGTQVRVDTDGSAVFGSGSSSVFSLLSDISDHLKNDPSKLADDLTKLDASVQNVRTSLSDVGSRYNRVSSAVDATKDATLSLTSSLSQVEDTDVASATVALQMQEVAYKAALSTTSKVLQLSLTSFLS